jgi:hypothetical protein
MAIIVHHGTQQMLSPQRNRNSSQSQQQQQQALIVSQRRAPLVFPALLSRVAEVFKERASCRITGTPSNILGPPKCTFTGLGS